MYACVWFRAVETLWGERGCGWCVCVCVCLCHRYSKGVVSLSKNWWCYIIRRKAESEGVNGFWLIYKLILVYACLCEAWIDHMKVCVCACVPTWLDDCNCALLMIMIASLVYSAVHLMQVVFSSFWEISAQSVKFCRIFVFVCVLSQVLLRALFPLLKHLLQLQQCICINSLNSVFWRQKWCVCVWEVLKTWWLGLSWGTSSHVVFESLKDTTGGTCLVLDSELQERWGSCTNLTFTVITVGAQSEL